MCRGLNSPFTTVWFSSEMLKLPTQSNKLINLAVDPPAPVSVTLDELLDGKHQAEYVSVTGVQFLSTGTFSGTKVLTDCESEVDVYTRSAATFSGESLPAGNGTLKGIASTFNGIQILLREPSELDMTGQVCGSTIGNIPGTEILQCLQAHYMNVNALSGWKTVATPGSKYWFSV